MTFPLYLIFSSADSFLLVYDHAQIYFILKQTIFKKTLLGPWWLSVNCPSFHFPFIAKLKSILF